MTPTQIGTVNSGTLMVPTTAGSPAAVVGADGVNIVGPASVRDKFAVFVIIALVAPTVRTGATGRNAAATQAASTSRVAAATRTTVN